MRYSDQPQFEHDCDSCKFLGHVLDHDLYYCPGEPTIVLRWDSEPSHYRSGICFCTEGAINALLPQCDSDQGVIYQLLKREALLRAITRGYIEPDSRHLEGGGQVIMIKASC
jgi:hypothetical protein